MIVMAIEAANQLADRNHPIAGFKIDETYFTAALLIPQTVEGIDTTETLSAPRRIRSIHLILGISTALL